MSQSTSNAPTQEHCLSFLRLCHTVHPTPELKQQLEQKSLTPEQRSLFKLDELHAIRAKTSRSDFLIGLARLFLNQPKWGVAHALLKMNTSQQDQLREIVKQIIGESTPTLPVSPETLAALQGMNINSPLDMLSPSPSSDGKTPLQTILNGLDPDALRNHPQAPEILRNLNPESIRASKQMMNSLLSSPEGLKNMQILMKSAGPSLTDPETIKAASQMVKHLLPPQQPTPSEKAKK